MSSHRLPLAIAALVVAAAVAAGLIASRSGTDDAVEDHGHDVEALVDWGTRTARFPHDRWTIEFCEGDAPTMCLTDAEGRWGGIELGSWPATELDVLEAAFARGASDAEALGAFADDFLRSFRQDRAEGCGAAYDFVPDASTATTVAGHDGLRYGFRGVLGGVTVEHIVGHAVIVGDTLHLFNAAGLADDGCLGREGEFPLDVFDADTVDLISRIVATSTLP